MAIKIIGSTIIDDSRNIVNAGIATVTSVSIGNTQVVSSARQLQNIASLDATTTATIEAAIQNAPNTFADLNVTGISTLGVTSATNLTAQQLNVSGVSTFQSNVYLGDNDSLNLGASNDFQIYHNNTSGGNYLDSVNRSLIIRRTGSETETMAQFTADAGVELYYNNSKKFETTGAGATIFGTLETQQLNVSGVSTFTGAVSFGTSAYFGDNDKIILGNDNDLEIYHSGTTSWILDNGTGNLALGSNGDRVSIVKGTGSETLARFNIDDSVELWFDNVKTFETTGYGATVFGTLQSQGLQVNSGVSTVKSLYINGGANNYTPTASGTGLFEVNGGASSTYSMYIGIDDAGGYIGHTGSGRKLFFDVNETTRMTIDSSGNLGIAITNPGARLNVVPTSTSIAGLFSGTTSSDMVRITQLGTGNALVVEDEANPDATPFVVTAAGSVGIGTTNPTAALDVIGNVRITGVSTVGFLTATNIWNAGITTSSRITLTGAGDTTTGGGQIYLNGATGNRIDFNTNGIAAPTTTTRSAGTKIVLYPTATVDYAFGIESNTLWSSIPSTSLSSFKWYAGITTIATLQGTGELLIGAATSTGTASQRLQVTGGAYVSGNVGIGTTNPQERVDIVGNTKVSGVTSTQHLNVTGIATIANLVVSGIITAVSVASTYAIQGSVVSTSSTTAQIGIHSALPSSTYRSVEYMIQAAQPTNFHATKILVVHNGTTAYLTEYGTIYNSSVLADYDVDISGGNIRLLSTPASAGITTYTISFTATRV